MLLIAAAVAWLSAQTGSPKVQWSQPQLLEFLLPSQQRRLTVTFRSDRSLADVEVFLTPSLANLVTVTPQTFKKIAANNNTQLTLTLKAPATSEVKFDGTLHLRPTTNPKSTYASPLALTLVIHNEAVPPDPGEAGKQTLAGTDSDHDGVRDDIERWIVLNHLGDPKTQLALRQGAKALQAAILATSVAAAQVASQQELASARCLSYITGDPIHTEELIKAEDDLMLNTSGRWQAYSAYTRLFQPIGRTSPIGDRKSYCDFSTD